ncbi:GNAT family N-acetyltransferase [uncultured Litoreibacter sp.]|uniref:GNAT family N-acetyltransferase n=1 Tax=uncultured Litoreibacter sp. TaxID=1392394 RepID=UPI002639C67D|nr:GNAT family N-acetyltransferase [uncultured Litoreibacter sp.]
MKHPTIRAAVAEDQPALMGIAEACGLFDADELEDFTQMTAGHFADPPQDHHWLITETEDTAIGAAYVTPEALADGVWNLWFIGLMPAAQGKGQGSALLAHVEALATSSSARLLLIETASGEDFANTRGFYLARGYNQEALIRDYHANGVDKVVFRKAL